MVRYYLSENEFQLFLLFKAESYSLVLEKLVVAHEVFSETIYLQCQLMTSISLNLGLSVVLENVPKNILYELFGTCDE